jgi:hypothetical protein
MIGLPEAVNGQKITDGHWIVACGVSAIQHGGHTYIWKHGSLRQTGGASRADAGSHVELHGGTCYAEAGATVIWHGGDCDADIGAIVEKPSNPIWNGVWKARQQFSRDPLYATWVQWAQEYLDGHSTDAAALAAAKSMDAVADKYAAAEEHPSEADMASDQRWYWYVSSIARSLADMSRAVNQNDAAFFVDAQRRIQRTTERWGRTDSSLRALTLMIGG